LQVWISGDIGLIIEVPRTIEGIAIDGKGKHTYCGYSEQALAAG
jgi:hypothetical protein